MRYRILARDGASVVELYERAQRDEIVRLFRAVTQPACLADGDDVIQVNSRGKSHEAAFKKFAAGKAPTAPTAPTARVAAPVVPETPMPTREPTKASVVIESAEVTVESDDDADDARESDVVPEPVETTAPPSATCTRGHGCTRPTARVQKRTRPGTEGWCTPCRRVDGAKEQRHSAKPTKPARAKPAAKAKPARTAKPSQSAKLPTLADALALAQRHAAVIASLGGIESAEALANAVSEAGGAAEVSAALTGLREIGGAA